MLRLVACFFMLLVAAMAPGGASASPGLDEFRLGFRALSDLIPAISGQAIEAEWHNAENGDGLQRTSTGLMVWRKADNWTAFTNGATTWINGPLGLQSRPNEVRFGWETQPVAPTPQPSPLITAGVEDALLSAEKLALDLVNRSRAECGLPPASMDESLRAVARSHARDMASRDYFGHYSPEGVAPWDRIKAAGIPFQWVAENLGWGMSHASVAESIRDNHLMMMQEKPPGDAHRRAILDPRVKRAGIGVAVAPSGKVLYVCDFAD